MKALTRMMLLSCACLAACAPLLAPSPVSTLDPETLQAVVAQTAAAAAAGTEQVVTPTPLASPTLLITTTATAVPSPTPTFIFLLASPTRSRPTATESEDGSGYTCEILSQMPVDDTSFAPGINFDTRWQVRNTGTQDWDENALDYRYSSGDSLHKQPIYDIYKTVPVGGQADIIVEMKAPANPGTYSTTWRLRLGNRAFCSMRLTIIVQ